MAELVQIKAQARARVGKGTARGARREGLVPAVIYGNKENPTPINVVYADVWKPYQTGHFFQTLLNIELDGKNTRVLPRDVQVDPVMDTLTHIDFLRVPAGAEIRVAVPVEFRNQDKSPGLKRGGVLNIVRHEVELYVPAEAIPENIVVDLEGLDIGASIHISHVKLPDAVRPVIRSRDFTLATIAGAMQEKAEVAAEGAAPAEGEAAAAAAPGTAAAPGAPAAGAKAAAGAAAPKAGGDAKAAAKPAAKK
ncbi:MAG: 50S ribosomal protein L25/general stress protein Ctc [Hyphomicrobiaceae bacterium]